MGAGTCGKRVSGRWQFLFSPILERANGDGQGPQVGVRTEDRNPLPDFALSRANAPGSLLRRSTKLVTAGEGLHPLRRR